MGVASPLRDPRFPPFTANAPGSCIPGAFAFYMVGIDVTRTSPGGIRSTRLPTDCRRESAPVPLGCWAQTASHDKIGGGFDRSNRHAGGSNRREARSENDPLALHWSFPKATLPWLLIRALRPSPLCCPPKRTACARKGRYPSAILKSIRVERREQCSHMTQGTLMELQGTRASSSSSVAP